MLGREGWAERLAGTPHSSSEPWFAGNWLAIATILPMAACSPHLDRTPCGSLGPFVARSLKGCTQEELTRCGGSYQVAGL